MKIHLDVREKPHECKYDNCGYRTTAAAVLQRHILARHKIGGRIRNVQCALCPAKFYSRWNLESHIETHVHKKSFKCSQCKFRTSRKSALKSHVKTVHERNMLTCPAPGCAHRTARPDTLEGHRRRIHDPDPAVRRCFACRFPCCPYRSSTFQGLKSHIKRHHNPHYYMSWESFNSAIENMRNKIPVVLLPRIFVQVH